MHKEELAGYLKLFHSGAQYAVRSPELARALCLSNREVRDMINTLRRDGIPICSNSGGYFYAATVEEVHGTIRHMTHRIAGISGAIHGLKIFLTQSDTDQLRFPLEGDEDA